MGREVSLGGWMGGERGVRCAGSKWAGYAGRIIHPYSVLQSERIVRAVRIIHSYSVLQIEGIVCAGRIIHAYSVLQSEEIVCAGRIIHACSGLQGDTNCHSIALLSSTVVG